MREITREIVGPFIFSKDGKLLLGHSRKGGVYKSVWIVPGGGIDEGETELEALIRETKEETGLDITNNDISKIDLKLHGTSEKVLRDTNEKVLVHMNFHNYRVLLSENADEVRISPDDDWQDPAWFAKEELANIEMSPPAATTLQHLGYL